MLLKIACLHDKERSVIKSYKKKLQKPEDVDYWGKGHRLHRKSIGKTCSPSIDLNEFLNAKKNVAALVQTQERYYNIQEGGTSNYSKFNMSVSIIVFIEK